MSTHYDEGSRSQLPAMGSISRSLRLLVREEDKSDNLFVRLSAGVATELLSQARRQLQNEGSAVRTKESGDAWTLSEEGSNDLVSFLPLCVSFGGNATIFGSFNGGICVSSSEQGMLPKIFSISMKYFFV